MTENNVSKIRIFVTRIHIFEILFSLIFPKCIDKKEKEDN